MNARFDRVVALSKSSGEAYVFRYDSESATEFLRTIGRFAADQELSFTWHDAAVLARSHRREMKGVGVVNLFDAGDAEFSACKRYRYRLTRSWSTGSGTVNFLMLNPSTADAVENDPTVERCERRARAWGFSRLIVTNLFAWRDTSPEGMKRVADPVGPGNDEAIVAAARESDRVICAWGVHGSHQGRSAAVLALLRGVDLWAFRVTVEGEPYHPLYLPYSLAPTLFRATSPTASSGAFWQAKG